MAKALNKKPLQPHTRDVRFDFDFSKLQNWHYAGRNMSHFLSTLSIFFPEGEQFFIDSVQHYRKKGLIKDKVLERDVVHFIGQEAMHGREHRDYNAAIEAQGGKAVAKEKFVKGLLKTVNSIVPPSMQLSATCALEHLTATLADALLRYDSLSVGKHGERCDPVFEAAWRWHALEETEHKGVAFDVYQTVVGKDSNPLAYTNRIIGHLLANAIFWPIALTFWLNISARSGDLFNFHDWRKAFAVLFGRRPGALRKKVPEWFHYFKPGFHPWDLQNQAFLQQVDQITERYAKAA